MQAIEVQNLTVSYHTEPVLEGLNFSLPEGKMTGIIGQNGSGKTTLLNAMLGLIKPVSGECLLYGQPFEKVRQRVSYVPQRESVDWDFPATVRDVVNTGRYGRTGLFGRLSREDKRKVEESIAIVGMSELSGRQIGQLSGGQRQRVFIARALAQEADLYFMDEPFAGVDAASEADILQLLLTMRKKGKTIVIVHHDLVTAIEYFDYALMLNRRVVACGLAEEVFTEEHLRQTYGGDLSVFSGLKALISRRKNTALHS